MAYTYSTPQTRTSTHRERIGASHWLEAALMTVAALLLGVAVWSAAASKSTLVDDATRRMADGQAIDLNTVTSADALAPFLHVFPDQRERQFAAREIVDHLAGGGSGPRGRSSLPNVGALARLTADARHIQAAAGLTMLQSRLRDARERGGGVEPRTLSLFTSSEIASLKPALTVREWTGVRRSLVLHVLFVLAAFAAAAGVRAVRRASGDPFLLPALLALSGIGLALMISLRDPLRDILLFAPFAQGVGVGALLLAAASAIDLERSVLPRLSYVPLAGALLLSLMLVTLGAGPSGSDARVNLFGVQPVDLIRLLVTLFLAGYFARRWEVLRELHENGEGLGRMWKALRVPRREDLIPVVGGIAVVLVGFFLQKDLGPALMVACVFLGMYSVARGHWVIATGGLLLLGTGFVAGYVLEVSSTLAARVAIWRSPWDNGARGGDQVAQALWAVASGGWTGTGLGHGMPSVVPAAHTDLVLAAVGEELGAAGVLLVGALFAVIGFRGFRAARRAAGEYSSLLAVGLTLGLIVPVLLIAGGMLGLVPLTGVVTPFLSYGRSSLVVSFAAVGLLLSIADHGRAHDAPSPFARGIRTLGLVCAALGLAVVGVATWTQTRASDEVIAAGALTRQGDGQRRYSYNPRLLAAAETIVRGTIYDRAGIPVATSEPAVLVEKKAVLASLGVAPAPGCGVDGGRCYPLGGPFYHLLGNAVSRTNWAAPNTSFVERDQESRLRGYDDQARIVEIVDPASGAKSRVVRRNLSALLPLWRHRGHPEHPEVKALLDQPRDVRLTIDARLQLRVATLLRERLSAARARKGAVVVMDATSGSLLASVSYPWPEASDIGGTPRAPGNAPKATGSPDELSDRLIDRARYGVYPPGSTFKLVTAAAVLRSSPALADERMICRRLDDGRVGNVVPGWRRPVRDDVGDTEPHGEVALERGVIHSCNAYFAQLGARLGGAPLREMASQFDIQLTRGNAPERLRDTLPFAAYGQGEVLATPYRMARVVAAIAADGVLPSGRLVLGSPSPETAPLRVLDAQHARRLASAMREVVVSGTGRGLMAHPESVAGKTGTAEIEGAPSHSWFVGFAPFGQAAGGRVAFAVIIENGGYGGRAAAPLAGEIVTAARELGLLGPVED
jgi:cell division protein FtsW (lipid II flippase)